MAISHFPHLYNILLILVHLSGRTEKRGRRREKAIHYVYSWSEERERKKKRESFQHFDETKQHPAIVPTVRRVSDITMRHQHSFSWSYTLIIHQGGIKFK